MAANDTIEIDGSVLEGGGQVLRNSTTYSCLLGRSLKVYNIRAGRSKPGLRPQHLTGMMLVCDLCNGKLLNGDVGSTEIFLHPNKIIAGSYRADTKTAGSICLLMQVSIPCLLFAKEPSHLFLRGGTNAEMAPQIDFTLMVFKPVAEKFGVKFDCEIMRRGYFPKGGGEVSLTVYPVKHLSPVVLTDRGEVTRIRGLAYVAGVLPARVAHIMAKCAEDVLRKEYRDVPIDITVVRETERTAIGTGTGIILAAETSTGCVLGSAGLGKKGVPAEKVGLDTAEMLLNNLYHGGCVDDFLQDQLIILMALAKGKSVIRCGELSLHTETTIYLAKTMTKAVIKVEKQDNGTTLIECEGIGLLNSNIT